MSGDQKSKRTFSIIVVIILILFVYFYLKDKLNLGGNEFYYTFGENPLIKLITLGIVIFVGIFIIKIFLRMFSKNV